MSILLEKIYLIMLFNIMYIFKGHKLLKLYSLILKKYKKFLNIFFLHVKIHLGLCFWKQITKAYYLKSIKKLKFLPQMVKSVCIYCKYIILEKYFLDVCFCMF